MYRWIVFSLCVVSLGFGFTHVGAQDGDPSPEVTEQPTPPAPIFSVEEDGVILDVFFGSLQQGRAGLLRLRGEAIRGATASLSLTTVEFFSLDGRDDLWAVIAVDMMQTVRSYELIVTVNRSGQDEPLILRTQLNITNGGFIRQEVQLAPDDTLNRLLDPEVEATELALIFDIASTVTDTAYWDENSFVAPSPDAELTSPFGAARVFNDELVTVHTGWDFNAATGRPLMATAAGKVAFTGHLDIRGNYVLIDHGRGIYSGYAHLSVIYVTQGQSVSEGQVIGLVGSTGRSSSSHAHFEMIANGVWIDATDFVQMYVP